MRITVGNKRHEFSKVVLGAVMVLYFVAAIYASVIVWNSPEHLPEYLAYIGTPTATAIGFYAWKAKNENVIKVAKDLEKETEKDAKKGKKTTPEAKAKLVRAVAEVLGEIETGDGDGT